MSREEQVLDSMRGIVDPDLGRDIVSLGFIKNLILDDVGNVSFVVELTTPACPVKEQFKAACEKAVASLPWVKKVNVVMSAAPRTGGGGGMKAAGGGLASIGSIIAVSSCKGGVGKSTVAVNLAYALSRLGGRVGIFDADVYGPSLPTMVVPEKTDVMQEDNMIVPLEHAGVKLMSFGYITAAQGGGPAIMRGPMVTGVINQLLTQTRWGELDYLVLDLPPGTGDIQLTLTQLIPITAAVIVTTPQQLSFVDVVKGIQMFDKLKVPTVAVVENMSYFECPGCHQKHHLFGQGARRRLVEQFGIRNSFEIPVIADISRHGDSGTPVMLAEDAHPIAAHYTAIADSVVREVSRIKFGGDQRPKIAYAPGRGLLITMPDGKEYIVASAELRRRCRCASCIEEFTGKAILDPASVSDKVFPRSIQPMGNYAVAISWSDGHNSSVYPYDAIVAAAHDLTGA